MKNPLVETVESELVRLGIHGKLIHESYDPDTFGNAEAVFEIGNLRLRFVRDRGDDAIDVLVPGSTEQFIFEDVSVAMGWQKLDEVVEPYDTIDFDKPPRGSISLGVALEYIHNDLGSLETSFATENLDSMLVKLRDVQSRRTKATFD